VRRTIGAIGTGGAWRLYCAPDCFGALFFANDGSPAKPCVSSVVSFLFSTHIALRV
jgi:hypothetical protein